VEAHRVLADQHRDHEIRPRGGDSRGQRRGIVETDRQQRGAGEGESRGLGGLARPHVVKIVHALGRAGYLETKRGRGGGFRLGRPPERIVVGEVVRLTEGELDIVECFHPETNTCPLIGVCRLSTGLQAATAAFMEVLDGLTVADISANRSELMARLAPLQDS